MSKRVPTNCTECDGCTWSVLEYEEGSRDRAFHASGWFHDLHTGWDLCPACRPDSPFTAVVRVRLLAEHARPVVSRGCTCPGDDCTGKCRRGEPLGWDLDPAEVLRALEGDSDVLH